MAKSIHSPNFFHLLVLTWQEPSINATKHSHYTVNKIVTVLLKIAVIFIGLLSLIIEYDYNIVVPPNLCIHTCVHTCIHTRAYDYTHVAIFNVCAINSITTSM